jgi:hypothetical protein
MKRKTIASMLIAATTVAMLVSGCGKNDKEVNKNFESIVTETEVGTETGTEINSEEVNTEGVNTENGNTEGVTTESVNTEDANTEEATHTCDYVTIASDTNNHWYVCSCGKTANSGAHIMTMMRMRHVIPAGLQEVFMYATILH